MNRHTPIPDSMKDLPIRSGYPVPYVADWTGENETLIRHDLRLDMPAIFAGGGKQGDGDPIFGRQSPERQRECMLDKRCQVCHVQLDGDFVWFIAGWVPVDPNSAASDPSQPHIEEPPLCAPCAGFSLSRCPGLNRQELKANYSGTIVYKTYEFHHSLEMMLTPLDPDIPAVHRVFAELTAYTKLTPDEFFKETTNGV